jgi:hypothetical protein
MKFCIRNVSSLYKAGCVTVVAKRGHLDRWEDNIKMNLEGTGLRGMDWIDLAQNRDQ